MFTEQFSVSAEKQNGTQNPAVHNKNIPVF